MAGGEDEEFSLNEYQSLSVNNAEASASPILDSESDEAKSYRKSPPSPPSVVVHPWPASRRHSDAVTLVWRDLCVYTVQPGSASGNFKRIINNATGAIQSGTLMALMGSSGAGKSTLMSVLAYRKPPGSLVQGEILLNGRPIGPYLHRLSGFVHQEDLFVGSLTVSEHLMFMAHLKLDRRKKAVDKQMLVRELIENAGLSHRAHSLIGDGANGKKVLSGGEKKRLAFATELLTEPAILFCDEPTTGLDSYSAEQLLRTLLALARRGTAIICTIHQPSSQLFAMFDQMLLLADGRVAFVGAPHEALDFFAGYGYICPDNYNPADFLIGVLATMPGQERASQRTAHRLCDLFAVSSTAYQRDCLVNWESQLADEEGDWYWRAVIRRTNYKRPFSIVKIYWIFYRTLLTVVRDSNVQMLRILQKITIALMAGLCFLGSVELSQTGVQSVQGALFITISENTFSPMYAVLAIFPKSFPLFRREKQAGLYNTAEYYFATTLAMLPGLIVEPLIFTCIVYWLANLRTTMYAFGMTVLASVLVMNVSTACGCFFSSAFNSVPMAMAYLVPFDYILMITSGVFVKLSSLPVGLVWTQYLSWLMYANEVMSIVQWENVTNITCNAIDSTAPCLNTGQEVLEQYSFETGNLMRDLWGLVVLYIAFHALGFFFLWKRSRKL